MRNTKEAPTQARPNTHIPQEGYVPEEPWEMAQPPPPLISTEEVREAEGEETGVGRRTGVGIGVGVGEGVGRGTAVSVTEKIHVAVLLLPSAAVQVEIVVPGENTLPEGGTQARLRPGQLSLAVVE
jgi:hypothetical protein